MLLLLYMTLFFVLSFIIGILIKAVKFNIDSTCHSMFECSFESSISLVSYSLQFFTLALSFIAFDFEIFLLLPFMGLSFHSYLSTFTLMLVVGVLTLLLYVELKYMVSTDSW